MNENLNEKIDEKPVILENVAKDVLDKLGYETSVNIFSNEKDQSLKVVAVSSNEDLSALIGKNGQNIKALEVANRVKVSKKAEALDPMSSYERRLIHVELASHPDLETESIGEEPERRVVIRPLII